MHKSIGSNYSAATKDGLWHRPYLLCNRTLPESIIKRLEKEFRVVLLPENHALGFPVSCHPDMLVFKLGSELLITEEYYKENRELFDGLGLGIVTTSESVGREYPHDVLLNALVLNGTLFARTASISEKIKGAFGTADTVDVKQGYAACSCCKVGDSAMITSDTGISARASERGFDVLTVTPGNVDIDCYQSGFIGGASFCYKDTVYFFGDVARHPDSNKIKEFIEDHGKSCVSLSDCDLFDFGGALPL